MSFTFKVKAEAGKLEVVDEPNQHPHVPDGTYMVAGHQDERWQTLSVGILDENGSSSFGASATRLFPKPPPAQT